MLFRWSLTIFSFHLPPISLFNWQLVRSVDVREAEVDKHTRASPINWSEPGAGRRAHNASARQSTHSVTQYQCNARQGKAHCTLHIAQGTQCQARQSTHSAKQCQAQCNARQGKAKHTRMKGPADRPATGQHHSSQLKLSLPGKNVASTIPHS